MIPGFKASLEVIAAFAAPRDAMASELAAEETRNSGKMIPGFLAS